MNSHSDMEKRIEETLGSLDRIERASPGHFFYTRVEARLNNQQRNAWDHLTSFLARPVVALAILVAVVASNVAVIYRESSPVIIAGGERTEISVLDDYSRQLISFYDPENSEP